MTNKNVYLKKLKLPAKYINDLHVALVLSKPGTLSKKEKEWLTSYTSILELREIKPNISRDKLSDDFKKTIKIKGR